jgi:hypothetical protein
MWVWHATLLLVALRALPTYGVVVAADEGHPRAP